MTSPSSVIEDIQVAGKEKVYFASDFHLGAPDWHSSFDREKKIIRWLEEIQTDAKAIFLLGDIFDFWFEYKHTVPRGFIRFLGKIAELRDQRIPIYFFTGNHDMWMFDYF
ncbi:MAG: metallophosphoesterase, partial [Bacteroidota bacterium]